MGLSGRQLDALQRGTVNIMVAAGLIGMGATIYSYISFSRYKKSLAAIEASNALASASASPTSQGEDLTSN